MSVHDYFVSPIFGDEAAIDRQLTSLSGAYLLIDDPCEWSERIVISRTTVLESH